MLKRRNVDHHQFGTLSEAFMTLFKSLSTLGLIAGLYVPMFSYGAEVCGKLKKVQVGKFSGCTVEFESGEAPLTTCRGSDYDCVAVVAGAFGSGLTVCFEKLSDEGDYRLTSFSK